MGYQEDVTKLAQMFRSAERAIVLTGAGISTESGIPDFRSPGTGLWEKMDPMKEASREAFARNPLRFYQHGFAPFFKVLEAKPNPAHEVLAWMEWEGFNAGVITQNIDGLHQKAGSKKVREVHGHMRSGTCTGCREVYPMSYILDAISKGGAPKCTCGSYIRPDVTLFGDSMPNDFWQSVQEAKQCDLMLVVGSSLEVSPANSLPRQVDRVAIINLGPTGYDRKADLVIREKAGKTLLDLKEMLQKGQKK